MAQPARARGPFERATREALEAVVSRPVAEALLARALATGRFAAIPEDIGAFRVYVESALMEEMGRVLDTGEIAAVLERLGNVLWMATSDVRALNVAREWTERGQTRRIGPNRESGSHPRGTARDSSPAMRDSSPAPMRDSSPAPMRDSSPAKAVSVPTAILVLTLDAQLVAQTAREVAGRCPVVSIATPAELARATATAGDRPVVLVDTTLPSIDVPTFVGLSPILPAATRVVLWGAEPRQQVRLASQFPRARAWIASADADAPGTLALSLG